MGSEMCIRDRYYTGELVEEEVIGEKERRNNKYRSGVCDTEVNVGNHGDDKGHDPETMGSGVCDTEVTVGNHGDDKGHDPEMIGGGEYREGRHR